MSLSPNELNELYRILEVRQGASLEEIERTYQGWLKKLDPNRFGNDKPRRLKAEEKRLKLTSAYEQLIAELGKNGKAPADNAVPATPAVAVTPQPSSRHWSQMWLVKYLWIAGVAFAMAFLLTDSWYKFRGIAATTAMTVVSLPSPKFDPTSPTGYPGNQHVQVMPALGTDGYHWLMQTELMLDGKEGIRVRHTDYDGPVGGRDVHWSSFLHWLTAGLAYADHLYTHDPMMMSMERTEPWANTFVLGLMILILPVVIARRFGGIAAALLALSFVCVYPYYEFSFVGYLDHHGLAASSDLLMVLFMAAAGAGWLRNEAIDPAGLTPVERALWKWLPTRPQAKRWLIASGVFAGTGLWISSASIIPAMFGVGLGALLSTGFLARSPSRGDDPLLKQVSIILAVIVTLVVTLVALIKLGFWIGLAAGVVTAILAFLVILGLLKGISDENPVGVPDATLWRFWGIAAACSSIFFYLLEYAPSHFTMRLEVNHPLYALALVGAGEVLCRFSWFISGTERPQGWFWRRQAVWIFADLLPLAVIGLMAYFLQDTLIHSVFQTVAFLVLLIGYAVYWCRRYFQDARLGKPLDENEAFWHDNWLKSLLMIALIGILPLTVLLGGEHVFVIRPGFLLNLHLDYILEFRTFIKQMGFLTPMQIAGGISMIPLVAIPAFLLLWSPDLQKQWKAVMSVVFLPAMVVMALAFAQIRWLGIDCALWCGGLTVAALVTTCPGSSFRWDVNARRLTALLILLMVLLPFPLFTAAQWYESNHFTPTISELDLTQVVTRDVSQRLRYRLGNNDRGVILSGPTTTTWMMYFGGFRGIGTLYWENVDGLRTAAAIYSATSDDEAKRLIDANHVTHIVIYQWDAFAEEYARLGAGMRLPKGAPGSPGYEKERRAQDSRLSQAFILKILSQHQLPHWLRPLPYHMPDSQMLKNSYVMIFEVVPEMSNAEYDLRIGQYDEQSGSVSALNNAEGELNNSMQAAVAEEKPNYLPTLVALTELYQAKSETDQAAGNPAQAKLDTDQFNFGIQRILAHLDQAPAMAMEDRVELTNVLSVANQIKTEPEQIKAAALKAAAAQAEAALAATDEKGLRHVAMDRLQYFLQISAHLLGPDESPPPNFDLAVSLLPPPAQAQILAERAGVLNNDGQPAKAAVLYRQTLKLVPEFEQAANVLARILATSTDPAVRNGNEALDLLHKMAATIHGQSADTLELLAYASATAGKFDDALFYAGQAAQLDDNIPARAALATQLRARMDLFRKHQAYYGP